MRKNKSVVYDGIIVFLAVEIIMLFLYILGKYAPFGENSLACMDANIQYLDLFGYFKDVLEGKNNIYYSFGKTLGGNNIAVFSYYLASPFNLLILFFKKTQLHVFFNLLFMLKMGMAGAFFSVFLNIRFDKSDIDPNKKIFIIVFSICYAFSQYNIAQSSNIMWIDGVYMLPLILLGVYNVTNNGKMWKLIIPVAFSILFNWYTAAINLLFSLLWIIMEFVLIEQNDIRTKAKAFVQYIFSIIIALMCSAVLFLPTIIVMKNSSRGDMQFDLLKDFSFKGDVLSIIESYTYGARSTSEKVSLYCGVLALVIFLEFFFIDKNRKRKLAFTFITIVNLLMFYWNPLYSVFSLLKNVASYWCRFSYLGIATLLFIAFYYLSETNNKEYANI